MERKRLGGREWKDGGGEIGGKRKGKKKGEVTEHIKEPRQARTL